MRRNLVLLVALGLAAAACGDGGTETGAPPTTADGGTSVTADDSPPTTPTTSLPGGELEPCPNPEGFTISAPVGWATNESDVLPRCSLFNPEPFDVPEATDQRVAAISASVERVPFDTAAAPQDAGDEDRALTAVEGRQAVRLSYQATGEGLYPPGTPIAQYLVDLGTIDGQRRTLILSTIGTAAFDHQQNVVVLDRMFRTIEITDPDVEADESVIASYTGGGGGFTVTAEATTGEICLRIPPGGESICTEPPADDQVHTIALTDLTATVAAGVTGEDVWRVDLVGHDGEVHSYLPATVPMTDLGAYAFPDTVEGFERLVLYDITGEELRTVMPGGA